MALTSDPVSMRKCVCVYYDQLQKIGDCEEGQEHLLLLVSSLEVSPTAWVFALWVASLYLIWYQQKESSG